MQYMLMFRETTESFATRQDQKAAPEYWGAWMAYIGALHASGKVVNGDPPKLRLSCASATASARCRTDHSPTRASILAVTSCSRSLRWRRRSNGRRARRVPQKEVSKCGR